MYLLYHPKIRGNYRSVPMETLLEEATRSGRAGRERIDSCCTGDNLYGKDLYGEKSLPKLLREL